MAMDSGYYTTEGCSLDEFRALVEQRLDPSSLQFTQDVRSNIPIYHVADLQDALDGGPDRGRLTAEWAFVIGAASGALVLRGAYTDTAVIDEATTVFNAIIANETEGGEGKGDHFAAKGANARIWNALQKLCEADPGLFARYFANSAIAAVCEAWLGPGYQMTAQVNVVRPGGAAQQAHRDYHLGFQSQEASARFPAHAHRLSSGLTLQGAVAHCDMPIESGPTKLLPFSQLYGPGYLAHHEPEFRDYFEEACIQLPLQKGDAVFFNPALFHAAGENSSDTIHRMANLLQVSSAFGRAMESVDRSMMVRRLYPVLRGLLQSGELSQRACAAVVACSAEGYAFPTNLDTNAPAPGAAPETQASLMLAALQADLDPNDFSIRLDGFEARHLP